MHIILYHFIEREIETDREKGRKNWENSNGVGDTWSVFVCALLW